MNKTQKNNISGWYNKDHNDNNHQRQYKKQQQDYEDSVSVLSQYVIPEPFVCKHWGCGKTLSVREQLFGNYCLTHNTEIKTVLKYVSSL